MPFLLAPFAVYDVKDFHVGGDPGAVGVVARGYHVFGAGAQEASVVMGGLSDGGFEGSEGVRFGQLLNADFPRHLALTGQSHVAVGVALDGYVAALSSALGEMGVVRAGAVAHYGVVQSAYYSWVSAQVNAVRATAMAQAATATAVASSWVPGVNAATAATAAAAQADAVSAQAALQAALVAWEQAYAVWCADVQAAAVIKEQLGVGVDVAVRQIGAAGRASFAGNPDGLKEIWGEITGFVDEHAQLLSRIATGLEWAGAVMVFIPGLQGVGLAVMAAGVGLRGVLAATGNGSWVDFAVGVATMGPLGAVGKGVKLSMVGSVGARASVGLGVVKSRVGAVASRGVDRVRLALDPVDIATGAMIDSEQDLYIDGVLPLVIERHVYSSYQVGRCLGPLWVCGFDARLEVEVNEITMVSPQGALLTFPHPDVEGGEVRGVDSPWLLSFGDGAYRVRAIDQGVVYRFNVSEPVGGVGTKSAVELGGGVRDESASLGQSMVMAGIRPYSVGAVCGVGVEVGLSSITHHTGHRIDYVWDSATGYLSRVVRSDGTSVDLEWDEAVGRVASVWVSNPSVAPEQEARRVVGYEYNAQGQLLRVVNSHDGVLRYHYDKAGLPCGWSDRNGVDYYYRFDECGRVCAQVGTGGFFANGAVWLDDCGPDAPVGGVVAVALETVAAFDPGVPVSVQEYLDRLYQLPLAKVLRDGGLAAAGLVGRGRDGARCDDAWEVPEELLHDEVLGRIRPTVYRASADGDVWRVVSPQGCVTDYRYNEYHQITAVIDSAGGCTRTVYNDDGVVVGRYYPDGSSEVIEPGAWGVPMRVTGRDGQVTEYEVDVFGQLVGVSDPAGVATRYQYQVRASGSVLSSVVDGYGCESVVACDDAGRVVGVVDPAGRATSMTRDVCGRVVETMDPAGGVTKVSYSPEGWPVRVVHPDGTSVVASYDGEGNCLSVVNEVGASQRCEYTVFDTLARHVDATGAVTELRYNTQLELVAVVNADGRRWSYEYDGDGRVVREVDYNGLVTTVATSDDGCESTVVSAAGQSVISFNALGLVETIKDGSGLTRYRYDRAGRVVGVDTSQVHVEYQRDDAGRVVGEQVRLASGELTHHQVDMDAAGEVGSKAVVLPGGQRFEVGYTRSGAGEVESVSVSHLRGGISRGVASGVSGVFPVAQFGVGVGVLGQRCRVTTGGLVRTRDVDARGRIVSDVMGVLDTQVVDGQRMVAGRRYAWRGDDVLVGISDVVRGRSDFDVDALGRVVGVSHTHRAGAYRGEWAGGALLGMGGQVPGDGVAACESYDFSPAGVLTSMRCEGGERFPGQGGGVGDMEFDGTMPVRVGRTRYVYDDAGRVVETVTKRVSKKPLVKRFYYAGGQQPVGFSSSDDPGVGYRYVYDGLGRRVAKEACDTASGEVIARWVFVYDGDVLIAQQQTVGASRGDGLVWVYDPLDGQVLGQAHVSVRTPHATATDADTGVDAGGSGMSRACVGVDTWSQEEVDVELYAMMPGLSGAPCELVDPVSGEVVGQAVQSLYGLRWWRGRVGCPLLFAGQYVDAESGWAYNRFRYYQPEAGMYNAQDPLGLSPRLASAQGYVDHAVIWIDYLGLKSYAQVADKALQARIDLLTPQQKGAVGEELSQQMFRGRFTLASPRTTYIGDSGKGRISDITLYDHSIVESKFVKKQGLDKQITDGILQAKIGGGSYYLVTAPETHLTRGLMRKIDRGDVIHRTMAEVDINNLVP